MAAADRAFPEQDACQQDGAVDHAESGDDPSRPGAELSISREGLDEILSRTSLCAAP
ncbi:MAG: hypothetical protein LDL22_07300 [Hyphomicrobiales bacterium]|uniref:hypothetical protein n=1 Tax=Rhabdaerophilum calidifontis TaxID=2604328 RepID=UPI00140A4B86|nr:hypothetical protein [Rhabdaerophilum calidifontis]MCA1952831.1 hypothetical protein [Hyphomicrobiales bacterium]